MITQDLIAQATTHKAAGNAHFSELRTNDALDQYREGINCLPVRKPPKIKNASKDSRGKGKDRLDLQEGLDFEAHDTDEKRESGMKSKDRIRELQDDQDEQQFFEEGKKSIEEQEVEQLRSILWSNVAACQLRLVSEAECLFHSRYSLKVGFMPVSLQRSSQLGVGR